MGFIPVQRAQSRFAMLQVPRFGIRWAQIGSPQDQLQGETRYVPTALPNDDVSDLKGYAFFLQRGEGSEAVQMAALSSDEYSGFPAFDGVMGIRNTSKAEQRHALLRGWLRAAGFYQQEGRTDKFA